MFILIYILIKKHLFLLQIILISFLISRGIDIINVLVNHYWPNITQYIIMNALSISLQIIIITKFRVTLSNYCFRMRFSVSFLNLKIHLCSFDLDRNKNEMSVNFHFSPRSTIIFSHTTFKVNIYPPR